MGYWKQGRRPRRRIRELIKLGVKQREAIRFGPITQKLLAAIQDDGYQQWVEQRTFQRNRPYFRAGAMVQDSPSGYGPIDT